jgi:hypothetical protein
MTRKVVAVAGMALVHKHGLTIQAIKQWREQQQESGLPSSLEDFYRAHGFCWACRSEGALLVGVRWTDEDGNQHTASMGTDAEPVGIAQLVRMAVPTDTLGNIFGIHARCVTVQARFN